MPSIFFEAFAAGTLILFVSLLCAGFFQTAGRIVRLGWKEAKLRNGDYALLAVGFFGLCCLGYGLTEPYNLETTHVAIKSRKLAAGAKPIRIAHVSDIHSSFIERVEPQLPTKIKELKPDIIVFTGDAANDSVGVERFRKCMKELSSIAPTFGVAGNHDIPHRDALFSDKISIKELNGSSETIAVRGTNVWIAGAAAENEKGIADTLKLVPHDAFSMFLYHYPVGLRAAVASKIDLFCAGHTHGGQVRLPGYGAILTNSELGKKYEWGLHKVDGTSVFISRGIGMVALPLRFLAPPEVAVIDVHPESKQSQR